MLKFFDCNCMIGRVASMSLPFDSVNDLLKEMEYYNIEKALVFHSLSWQNDPPLFGNGLLLKEVKGKSNLYPVAVVSPWDTSKKVLSDGMKKIIEEEAYGIRLFPVFRNFDFSDFYLSEIIKIANKLGLLLIIDFEQINNFGGLKEMLGLYPNVTFIISKISYGNNRFIYPLLGKYKNLCIETSLFRTYQGIEDIVKNYGAEKILFGSYMPLQDAGAVVSRIVYSGLSREDKEKIAYKNIENIISKVRR